MRYLLEMEKARQGVSATKSGNGLQKTCKTDVYKRQAEMHTHDIGCLADLLSDSRASGGVGCGIVRSKSSCK